MHGRTYEDTMAALGTLISSLKRSDGSNWEDCFRAMHTFLDRLQLTEALKGLKVIHVAGTKGKGSTCCMVESMLRAAGYRTGLFTSPHLCDVRERIRINGRPVEKETFLRYFWDCFLTFKQSSTEAAGMPAYFRFLTLLGLKLFIEEKVEVVVLEVGLGGRLDATNIIPHPVVCGVSSLGYDHMELLGHTLTAIATEKAGIFKTGTPAFTVAQEPEAQQALSAKAVERNVTLSVVPCLDRYRTGSGKPPRVGLAGSHQKINATLAISLAGAFEAAESSLSARENSASLANGVLPDSYARGLEQASWPGRCQIVQETINTGGIPSQLAFYLDGAHTPESMQACGEWFTDALESDSNASGQHNGPLLNSHPLPLKAVDAVKSRRQTAEAAVNGHAPRQVTAEVPTSYGSESSRELRNGHGSREADGFAQNFLIFNCMQEREPEKLFRALMQVLDGRGARIHHALFVPPDSLYSKPVSSWGGEERDLSWQLRLRDTWEASLPPLTATRPQARADFQVPALPKLPSQDSTRGAVLPGLKPTLAWLRGCARDNAGLRIRVLVTGSLYLVGDMLRHLGQEL